MQVKTQKESDKLRYLTTDDTPITGQNQYFQNNAVDSNYDNYYYGIESDMTEAFIYEEENRFVDSCNEDYFTTEEFFFAASILDSTYFSICLPSDFSDTYYF